MESVEKNDHPAADICMSTKEVQEPSTSHAVPADPLRNTACENGQQLDLLNRVQLLNVQMEKVLAPVIFALKALGTEVCCFSEDKISFTAIRANTAAGTQVNAEPFVKCPHFSAKRFGDNEMPYMEVPGVESAETGPCRIKRFRREDLQ